jgi:hypothetical protein
MSKRKTQISHAKVTRISNEFDDDGLTPVFSSLSHFKRQCLCLQAVGEWFAGCRSSGVELLVAAMHQSFCFVKQSYRA